MENVTLTTALVIGATGLVGKNVVQLLLADDSFEKVKIFVRRSTNIKHEKLEEIITPFDNINEVETHISGDVLFSAMGTTLAVAGNKMAQYQVDYTFQYEFAKLAREKGVQAYVLVSSTGAKASSWVFYSRMKGQLEDAVKLLGFARTIIIRPSVLMGERPQQRKGEYYSAKAIQILSQPLPFLRKYRGILGSDVAAAMIHIYKNRNDNGIRSFELDELLKYV